MEAITYNEFKYMNDKIKDTATKIGRIEQVDLSKRECVLEYNGVTSVESIDNIVDIIMSGRGCITNPSILTNFKFKDKEFETYKKKHGNMFYYKNTEIKLCHGSSNIIKQPYLGGGSKTTDYGPGFYCVSEQHIELAKEWACSMFNSTRVGYVNKYTLKTEDLKILNLNKYSILNWIAITAKHRGLIVENKEFNKIIKEYYIDISEYDCIFGWRCDDTFSKIITNFANEIYTAEAVEEAIKLGYLQNQFVLKTQKAYDSIVFDGYELVKDFETYRNKFESRKAKADAGIKQCQRNNRNGRYIYDIIK